MGGETFQPAMLPPLGSSRLSGLPQGIAPATYLLDHLICPDEERWRYRDPQHLGGLEIEGEVIFRGLLHGQIRWLGPLQDLADEGPGALSQGRTVCFIGRTGYEFFKSVYPLEV